MEKWIVKGGKSLPFIQKYNLHPLLARILAVRIELDKVPYYMDREAPLFRPWLMCDMEQAVSLIRKHLEKGSHIRIVGDYDVDGLTSSSILYLGLSKLIQTQLPKMQSKITCRIPERIGEGYGFSLGIAEEAKADRVDLIITCDNGIREMASANFLKDNGIDMVVTDHHEILLNEKGEDELPNAGAVINPHRKGDQSPQRLICGAFVALQLIRALYEVYHQEVPEILYGYGALGTVCDVMPLVEENRKLVHQGFAYLNKKPSVGMKALMEAGSVKEFNTYTAGYVIGPMLNAGGRLGSQNRFLDIMLSEDEKECQLLAKELFDLNRQRQQMTEEGIADGIGQVESKLSKDFVKVVYLPNLHESIAGLVAGKLKEKYQRPVFVLTKGEKGLKGSGRSIPAYHMFQKMNEVSAYFSKFGGHAMAAGLSVDAAFGEEESVVQRLRTALNEGADLTEEDCIPTVYIDAVMPIHQLDVRVIQLLEELAPYGTGNPRPLLAQKNLLLKRCQILGKKQNVVKLTLVSEGQGMDAISFEVPNICDIIRQHSGDSAVREVKDGKYFTVPFHVDMVYQPEIDMYTGIPKVKIMIQHMRISE